MIESNLFKLWQRYKINPNQTAKSIYVSKINRSKRQLPVKSDSGFTLIEMLVVVIIIAVLSAIAAPGWLAFTNRQRVSKVNDRVFSALQKAQSEAKRTKLSYSVSFKQDPNDLPKVAVYPTNYIGNNGTNATYTPIATDWQPLAENQDIKPNQITLIPPLPATSPITFDYQGNVTSDLGNNGVKVGVSTPNDSTKRCVIIQTLLGAMKTAQDTACN